MNHKLVEQPICLKKQADAVLDFGDGKIVEFQINVKGCKDNDEKRELSLEAIDILKWSYDDIADLSFRYKGLCFYFHRSVGKKISILKIKGPIQSTICLALFREDKLVSSIVDDDFIKSINVYLEEKFNKKVHDTEQIRRAVMKINKKFREKFKLEQGAINYNDTTKIISANKILFTKKRS